MAGLPHSSETPRVTTATIVPNSDGPLTAEHRQALALARDLAVPVRSAARAATFNAWTTGIIAALSAPFALFSVSGFIMAAGLTLVAYNEFRGRRRLLEFEPAAAATLGWNQIGLLALIVVYCVWTMVTSLTGDSSLVAALAASPELNQAGVELSEFGESFVQLFVIGFYGTVIGLSVIFQGANAIYYFTRRKYVARYVAETPAWVRDLQRASSPA